MFDLDVCPRLFDLCPVLFCLSAVCSRLSQQNLIGQQPSTYAKTYNGQHCQAQSDVPMCSDDDWVSKCPSGCRVQGMISQMESEVERKLRMVCKKAKMYEDAAEKTMKAMTHVYNRNRRVIVDRYISELKFVEHSQGLARNLTSLRRKSSRLSKQLQELNHKVQEQVRELYRTEVDIDMKLRACQGSCKAVVPFTVRHHSYETLQTAMQQLGKGLKKKKAAAVPLQDIPHINLQPIDVSQVSSADYKTIPTVQRELLTQFEDIGQNRIFLEELLTESEGVEADSPSELE
ncbi:fibrinogen alpha chain [Cheilinus undulatus]|uniref:fibrinogen alpha chain n=1 Tax=Cheilinus undulatus TaxID=241271 RepID=UPI001BD4A163|nr:fibrinogen alpha chain [Cheilinus undulatus]